ncbi:hypothetical protein Dsin_006258 [Dipteronia sinensis]|uniref:SHSP domain-containing protein n=1 Tax=Dipteronia sinensis TaxID=43782 RepID=A0AAE0AY67_9ROSI|nr:hypothetical protein Dsin_006258 [Dipteronia sinensis]
MILLTDFKTQEVKLDIDESGHLVVSGERLLKATGNKFKIFMFEQTFTLLHNSDIDQISGKMEGEIFRITVPKRPLVHEDHENVDQINKEIYKQESPEDDHENKYRGGGVNDDTKEVYKQESYQDIDENKYGSGGGGRVVGGGGSGRLDHMDEKSEKNSQIDCFSGELARSSSMSYEQVLQKSLSTAHVKEKRGVRDSRPLLSNPIVRDFVPSSGWTEDSNARYLLVDLPDFSREEVEVDTSSHLTISGERQTSDNRYIFRFQQTHTLPPDSDINSVSGNLDLGRGILYVTVPKLVSTLRRREPEIQMSEIENTNSIVEEHKQETPRNDENDRGGRFDKEEKREKNSRVDDFPEEAIKKWEKEPNHQLVIRTMRKLEENKQIVFITLLAFSLGAWVSRKVESRGHV